jgi:hypothetical protein
VAVTLPPSTASATTWLLVTMWPWVSKTKPVPVPPSPSLDSAWMVTVEGSALAATPATVPGSRLTDPPLSEAETVVEPVSSFLARV